MRGVGRRPTHRARAFDPDHLGAHVGEQHRGERSRTDPRDLDDAEAGERPAHEATSTAEPA